MTEKYDMFNPSPRELNEQDPKLKRVALMNVRKKLAEERIEKAKEIKEINVMFLPLYHQELRDCSFKPNVNKDSVYTHT